MNLSFDSLLSQQPLMQISLIWKRRCRDYTLHFKPVDGSLVSSERNEKKIEAKMANRQRTWPEDGKTGRLFILFCSLILSRGVTEVWKRSLTKTCTTRSIRSIERTGRAKQITPFVKDQLTICEAFGFEVPKG